MTKKVVKKNVGKAPIPARFSSKPPRKGTVVKRAVPKHPGIRRTPAKKPGPMAAMAKQQQAGAVNIAQSMFKPSETLPIRFPNVGDTRLGTVPIKEQMNFTPSLLSPAAFDTANDWCIFACGTNYYSPFYLVTSADASGNLTWGSVGNPKSYAAMTTNAALLRVNATSMKVMNTIPLLDLGGVAFILSWQAYDSNVTLQLPASIGAITQSPMCKRVAITKNFHNDEFVPNKETIAQEDWTPPTSQALNSQTNFIVIALQASHIASMSITVMGTLAYEYVPETAYQILADTKSTVVPENVLATVNDAISSTNNAGSNTSSAGPGLWDRVKSVASEVGSVASDVWDFAQPYVSAIGSFLGFLEPDPLNRQSMLLDLCRINQEIMVLHHKSPQIVDLMRAMHTSVYLTARAHTPSARRLLTFETYNRNSCRSLIQHILFRTWHTLHPSTKKFLINKCNFQAPQYGLDLANVTAPYTFRANKLYCEAAWAMDLAPEQSPGEFLVLNFSQMGMIWGPPAAPYFLMLDSSGNSVTVPLYVAGKMPLLKEPLFYESDAPNDEKDDR